MGVRQELKSLVSDMLRLTSLCDSHVSIRIILKFTNEVRAGNTNLWTTDIIYPQTVWVILHIQRRDPEGSAVSGSYNHGDPGQLVLYLHGFVLLEALSVKLFFSFSISPHSVLEPKELSMQISKRKLLRENVIYIKNKNKIEPKVP